MGSARGHSFSLHTEAQSPGFLSSLAVALQVIYRERSRVVFLNSEGDEKYISISYIKLVARSHSRDEIIHNKVVMLDKSEYA